MEVQQVVWRATEEDMARSRTAEFMALHGIGTYEDLVRRSAEDIEWFWEAAVEYLGIPFSTPYHTVLDAGDGPAFPRWFLGGRVNVSEACVDRWAARDPDRVALVAEREDGVQRTYSFGQLLEMVERAAGALIRVGASKGDTVAVYLSMIPEAVVAMLAAARIGAIYVPIFSGFGAEAVASRLEACDPAVVVTADGYTRRGRPIAMKEVADRAIEMAGVTPSVLVVSNLGRTDAPWTRGRDRWWEEALDASERLPALATSSEDPVLLAYTSGTTGKPKGVVHVQGGLTAKLAVEGAFQFEIQPEDRVMWMTDMGWIMGPWTVMAGMGNGASVVCYDGAPDYPTPGRPWDLVGSLGITILGISPTLVRALQPHGARHAAGADFSTLRAFGSTGEPWNPARGVAVPRCGRRAIPDHQHLGRHRGRRVPSDGQHPAGDQARLAGRPLSRNGHGRLRSGGPPHPGGGGRAGLHEDVAGDHPRFLGGRRPLLRHLLGSLARRVGTRRLGHHRRRRILVPARTLGRHLNIAGKRIGPAEVESAVVAHPDVVMAAAIGIPDPVKGEVIAVFVVTTHQDDDDSDEQLAEELSDAVVRALGKPFRPAAVRFVADLPRTRSAKIMRRVVAPGLWARIPVISPAWRTRPPSKPITLLDL